MAELRGCGHGRASSTGCDGNERRGAVADRSDCGWVEVRVRERQFGGVRAACATRGGGTGEACGAACAAACGCVPQLNMNDDLHEREWHSGVPRAATAGRNAAAPIAVWPGATHRAVADFAHAGLAALGASGCPDQ